MTPPTEPADLAEAQEPAEPTENATIPPWWDWVSRHRTPVGLVAGLVVVALVATFVTIAVVTPGPKDVVRDYMNALQAGDTDTALEIVGEPDDNDARLSFLSPDALADDWTVDAVVERHRRDESADVDVTISAGGTSRQGRFHVVDGDDGWRIESPFVRVDLVVGGLDAVELGGVRLPVRSAANQPTMARLLLFPGAYDLYPSLAERVTFEPGVLVAAPQPSAESADRVEAAYTLTGAGVEAAQQAVDARVKDCAATRETSPPGCPFNAEDSPAVRHFMDVTDITWQVRTYPEAAVVPSDYRGLRLVVRKPGTVTLTGTGYPWKPEGAAGEPFTRTCEFGVDGLTVAVTTDGITLGGLSGAGHPSPERNTRCF